MRIRQILSFLALALMFAGAPAIAQTASADLIAAAGADGQLSDAELVEISMALAAEGNSPDAIATALNSMPVTPTPAQIATGLAATGVTQAQVQASVQTATGISAADAASATNTGFTNATNVAGATTIAAATGQAANQANNATVAATTNVTLTSGGAFTTASGQPVIIKSDADLAVAVASFVNTLPKNQPLTDAQKSALTSLVNSNPILQSSTNLINAISSGNTSAVVSNSLQVAKDNGATNLPPGGVS